MVKACTIEPLGEGGGGEHLLQILLYPLFLFNRLERCKPETSRPQAPLTGRGSMEWTPIVTKKKRPGVQPVHTRWSVQAS
jgi:hypothetical protein